MKKIIITIIIAVIAIGAGTWWYFNSKSENDVGNKKTSTYQAERSSTATKNNNNGDENTSNVENNSNTPDNKNNSDSDNANNQTEENTQTEGAKKETEIASFTTKIHNKDKERQNNMKITCDALTNKEIKAGETFSFCNTVGKSTTAKGYQKADIYVDGKKEQGLGGGNCQVSTTLYNAVNKVSGLNITERHQHSGKVPYIQSGKDAAVAYGAYDFKFKNNTGNTIKIVMEKTEGNVTAKIIKLE